MFPNPKWLRRKGRWNRIPAVDQDTAPAGLLAPSELERAFQRERARVDRNDKCFSIVVFRLEAKRPDDRARLAEVLIERVRAYDAIGEVDPNRLAALLPETNGEAAWVFADNAMARLAELELKVACDVYTYPHPGTLEGGHTEAAKGPTRPTQPIDRGPIVSPPAARRTGTGGTVIPPAVNPSPGEPNARLRAVALQPVQHPEALLADRPIHDLAPLFEERLPFYRRAVDVLVAATGLVLLSPLLLTTAVAVKLSSPGPIIFSQWRAGRGGRPFRFYKFRSMYQDAEERKNALRLVNEKEGPIFKIKNDPRITPVGRLIRKLSVDELPQLVNVLRGDMTLVGPRPPVMDEVDGYEAWQRQRLDITGGLTCIWQVSGRSEVSFEEWMRMDIRYKQERSLRLDLKLLWKTIGAVFTGRGAY